jgi:hypothetical protein
MLRWCSSCGSRVSKAGPCPACGYRRPYDGFRLIAVGVLLGFPVAVACFAMFAFLYAAMLAALPPCEGQAAIRGRFLFVIGAVVCVAALVVAVRLTRRGKLRTASTIATAALLLLAPASLCSTAAFQEAAKGGVPC